MAIGGQLTPKWLALLFLVGCAPLDQGSAPQQDRVDPLYEGLDGGSLRTARNAVQTALESLRSHAAYKWEGTAGSSGSITPTRTFRIATGHYCREYQEAVSNPAGVTSANRIACRDGQGFWQVVRR